MGSGCVGGVRRGGGINFVVTGWSRRGVTFSLAPGRRGHGAGVGVPPFFGVTIPRLAWSRAGPGRLGSAGLGCGSSGPPPGGGGLIFWYILPEAMALLISYYFRRTENSCLFAALDQYAEEAPGRSVRGITDCGHGRIRALQPSAKVD